MKESTTSARLKELMRERGLKQVDVLNLAQPLCAARGIALSKSSLNQYVSGYAEPGRDKLAILGEALDVSEAWLMGYRAPRERDFEASLPRNVRRVTTRRFPMLGAIACGKPLFADTDHESYIDASADIKADFCLTAKGESMTGARIFDGDVVFIRTQPMVDNGQIAAVIIDNEATLKRWYYYPEREKLILSPENPAYEPLVFIGDELKDVRCLGRAVCFMSKL